MSSLMHLRVYIELAHSQWRLIRAGGLRLYVDKTNGKALKTVRSCLLWPCFRWLYWHCHLLWMRQQFLWCSMKPWEWRVTISATRSHSEGTENMLPKSWLYSFTAVLGSVLLKDLGTKLQACFYENHFTTKLLLCLAVVLTSALCFTTKKIWKLESWSLNLKFYTSLNTSSHRECLLTNFS